MTDENQHELRDNLFLEDLPDTSPASMPTLYPRAPVVGEYPSRQIQGVEFVTDHSELRKQIGGSHYNRHRIQPIDVIDEYGMGFLDGNVLKYIMRYPDKGGTEDLRKAIHYLEMLIEKENRKSAETP